MLVTNLTATQTIYGLERAQQLEDITNRMGFPIHPALASLEYEDERTDVHGIGSACHGWSAQNERIVTYTCTCGVTTPECATMFDATCALISHALRTCAQCGDEKPSDNFPRCSGCAF